ncbi:MAG: YhfC family glutamic-type intramembrane protease [Candidatus Methanofastidiosia archaeon]
MLYVIPYIVYFLGPFLLAFFLGRKILKVTYRAFLIGLFAFFVAWVCILIVTVPTIMRDVMEGTILFSLVISASAGLFEESSRFFAFNVFKGLREKRNWNTGIMYAIGHSGMESIIVGGSLLLTFVVVKHVPELLSPEILSQSKEVLEIGFLQSLYNSFERLLIGLLIHSCFTSVVLLSLVKSQKRYLLFAMLWHFVHNMVGLNLYRLSEHWIVEKLWILFIVVVYSLVLFKLRRKIANSSPKTLNNTNSK